MLLLTGATGLAGTAVLRRLVARGEPVRCLVRDAPRLGAERVRVQLAIGDLSDPPSWRHALRGVRTVVHLAATERDQPRATIEEIDGLAAVRLLRGAERAGAERFLWLTRLGATPHHPRACRAPRRSPSRRSPPPACPRQRWRARSSMRPATAACTGSSGSPCSRRCRCWARAP